MITIDSSFQLSGCSAIESRSLNDHQHVCHQKIKVPMSPVQNSRKHNISQGSITLESQPPGQLGQIAPLSEISRGIPWSPFGMEEPE